MTAGIESVKRTMAEVVAQRRTEMSRGRRFAEACAADGTAAAVEHRPRAPFAAALQERTGLPVFDIVTLTDMVHATLTRRPYAG